MIERYYEMILVLLFCVIMATTMIVITSRLTYQAISNDYVDCLQEAVDQADCEYILGTFN